MEEKLPLTNMTSIVAHATAFPVSNMVRPVELPNLQTHDPQLQRQTMRSESDEKARGRRRSRAQGKSKQTDDNGSSGDALDDQSSGADGPSRKRRRSRKGLDKKFECPHEGCGKSYSRAEHL